jgi:hypothetical protein
MRLVRRDRQQLEPNNGMRIPSASVELILFDPLLDYLLLEAQSIRRPGGSMKRGGKKAAKVL